MQNSKPAQRRQFQASAHSYLRNGVEKKTLALALGLLALILIAHQSDSSYQMMTLQLFISQQMTQSA